MQVIAYDPYVQAPQGVEQVPDMDEILSRSDYLTFHLPLTEETRNMIGPQEFAKMKTGVRVSLTAPAAGSSMKTPCTTPW